MRRFNTVLCLLLMAIGSHAGQVALRVWTGPEASTLYVFSQRPVVRFTAQEIQVKANEAEFAIDKHEYVKFTFEDSDIDDGVHSSTTEPSVDFKEGNVNIASIKPDSRVQVFALNGTNVLSVKAGNDGCAHISLSTLPAGVYIIRSQAGSFKITKK